MRVRPLRSYIFGLSLRFAQSTLIAVSPWLHCDYIILPQLQKISENAQTKSMFLQLYGQSAGYLNLNLCLRIDSDLFQVDVPKITIYMSIKCVKIYKFCIPFQTNFFDYKITFEKKTKTSLKLRFKDFWYTKIYLSLNISELISI